MASDPLLRTDAFLTEELLKLALESSGVAIWQMDPASEAIEWTAACKRIFGVPLDREIDYAFFLSLLHPDDRDTTNVAVRRAFDPNGSGDYDVEYRAVLPDGGFRWIAARGRALFSDRGDGREAVRFIGTVRDISGQKEAEGALQAAVEEKQMLLLEVNHRVKNSLQLVSSLLRLQARRIDDPDLRHQLEDAMTRISAIAHVHQRLYRDQDVKRVDFGAFLAELCADLQSATPQCSVQVDSPHIRVPTDRAISLALIVNELVSNAVKYAYPEEEGGVVSVGVANSGAGEIVIGVSDDGVGLPDGFATDDTRSLGMILVGSLLGQLDGRLDIPRKDKGAAFVVTAPIEGR